MRSTRGALRLRIVLVVFLAVTPILGFVLYSGLTDRSAAVTTLRQQLSERVRNVSDGQARLVEGAHQLLLALTQVDQVRNRESGACDAFMGDVRSQYRVYANLGAATLSGDVYCSAIPLQGPTNISDRSYFVRAIQTGGFAIGDYQIGRITGRPTINFGVPIRNVLGEPEGLVFAALSIDALRDVISPSDLPRDGAFSIFDANGRILARHPDPDQWVGKRVPDAAIVVESRRRRSGYAEVPGIDGVTRLYSFRKITGEGTAVFVAIGVPRQAALAPANRALTLNLLGIGAGALMALIAAVFVGDALVGKVVRAEEALASLGAILESTHDAVIGLSRDGRITTWNPAAAALYGVPAGSAIGQPIEKVIEQRGVDLEALLERATSGETIVGLETTDVTAEGRVIDTSKTFSPIRRSDHITGMSVIVRDVSAQKEAERALKVAYEKQKEAVARLQEVDQLKSEFVGIVSHDLRSPMSVISGYARILQAKWSDISDEKKLEFLGAMLRTVDTASALVSDTLEVARIESGEIDFQPTPFSMTSLASSAVADLAVSNPDRRVEVELEENLPLVFADEDRVRQVLNNLTTNALKFSASDQPIQIRVYRRDDTVALSVADRGIGIEPDDLPNVFERFTRVRQPGPQARVKGTGLGLYICRKLVEAQGGQIWAESEVGEGSTFSIALPTEGKATSDGQ